MNRLKDLREYRNLTLEKVGKILNTTKSVMCDFEKERILLSSDKLCTLADYYNTSTDYIVFNTDDIVPHTLITRVNKNRLKDIRKSKKLTQENVGKEICMTQSGYSNYERDIADVPIPVLLKLSEFYKVSIDYILCRTDDPTAYPKSKVKNI